MRPSQHHITVRVSPEAFEHNIRYLRRKVAPSRLCVVMKANAYGHGLIPLAPVAARAGADWLGICTNPEAADIRTQLPHIRVMRLRAALPEELQESLRTLEIEEQVGSLEVAQFLDGAGQRRDRPVPVHLKIDTGMGRSGFFPEQLGDIERICAMPGLRIVGLMTHLAQADAPDLDDTLRQLDIFHRLRNTLRKVLPDRVLVHTHNSAATLRVPKLRGDLVRVGAACYGVRTSRAFANPEPLRPVMSVKTRVLELRRLPAGHSIGYGRRFVTPRQSRIATIPVGFGEGYPRALFNKGIVLIHGRRCPVVGRVSLNIITVDVTDLAEEVGRGDEVVLIGRQGDEEVSFEEMADRFDSVHTELNLSFGALNEVSHIP